MQRRTLGNAPRKRNREAYPALQYAYTLQSSMMCVSNCLYGVQDAFKKHEHPLYKMTAVVGEKYQSLLVTVTSRKTGELISPEEDKQIQEEIATILDNTGIEIQERTQNKPKPTYDLLSYLAKGLFGCLSGLTLLILSACGVTIPLFWLCVLTGVVSLLSLYLGKDIYQNAMQNLYYRKKLNMNFLLTISIFLALGASIAALFTPVLHVMLNVPLLILGLHQLGRALEEYIKPKTRTTFSLQEQALQGFLSWNEGTICDKFISEVKQGDIIIIPPGGTIPLDGRYLGTTAPADHRVPATISCFDPNPIWVDQCIFTGNPNKSVERNDILHAGMIIKSNKNVYLRVAKTKENSYLFELDKAIKKAHDEKKTIQSTAESITPYFIGAIVSLAVISAVLCCWTVPPAMVATCAVSCAVAVLVSACPCFASMIPACFMHVATIKANQRNITFRNATDISQAAESKIVVFDYHGTLTEGKPTVTEDWIGEGEDPDAIYALVQEMEKGQPHHIAQAIRKHIDAKKITRRFLDRLENKEASHCGIKATIGETPYLLGNEALLTNEKFAFNPEKMSTVQTIYLTRDKEIIAKFFIEDKLRKESKDVISLLEKKLKRKVFVCTGGGNQVAAHITQTLGIPAERIKQNCSPTDKIAYIVAVGDSANDVLMLAGANCGIAVSSPTAHPTLRDHAGACVDNSLRSVVTALSIADQAKTATNRSILFSFGFNFITVSAVILPTMLGVCVINPALGMLLMTLQMGAVFCMAQYFQQADIPHHASNYFYLPQGKSTRKNNQKNSAGPSPVRLHNNMSTFFPRFVTSHVPGHTVRLKK